MDKKITLIIQNLSFGVMIISYIVFLNINYQENLDYSNYVFGIWTDPHRVQLFDFQIYHDFTTDKGKINFDLTRTNDIDSIIFKLPKELHGIEFNFTNKTRTDKDYKIYIINEDYSFEWKNVSKNNFSDYNLLFLDIKNKSNMDYWSRIELNYKGKLYPNAEFEFDPETNIQPSYGKNRGAFFKFKLGELYPCSENCFEKISDNIKFYTQENSLLVAQEKKSEYVGHSVFILNYNKKINESLEKKRELAFNIFLLAVYPSGEFVITLLMAIFTRNKKKKS